MRQQTSNFRSYYPSLPCTSPEKTASGPTKKKKNNQPPGLVFPVDGVFFSPPGEDGAPLHGLQTYTAISHWLGTSTAQGKLTLHCPQDGPETRLDPQWWSEGGYYGFPHLFFKTRWKKNGKIFCQLGLFCKLVILFVQCALGYKGNLWNHPALGYNNYMFTNCQGEAVCCYSLGTWQRQFPIHRQGACCD